MAVFLVQLKDSEDLWRVNLKIGESQAIRRPDESAIRWMFLDDERIVYWIPSGKGFGGLGDIYIARLDGVIERRLTYQERVEHYVPPIEIPNWIYFLNDVDDENSTLYRIHPDGSNKQEIARNVLFVIPIDPPSGHTSQWIHYQGAYWGPYYRAPVDGGEAEEIPRPFYAANDYTHDLQFSPDGEWVYFTVFSGRGSASHLLRTQITATTDEVPVVVEYGQSPIWSSDAQWIIYRRTDENDFNDLYRARPDGSNAELIAEYITGPSFVAEDGHLVVYNAFGANGGYIAALNLSTFENRILVAGSFKSLKLETILPFPTIIWDAECFVLLIGVLCSLTGLSGFVEGNAIRRRARLNPR